jgi:hypothetical protein
MGNKVEIREINMQRDLKNIVLPHTIAFMSLSSMVFYLAVDCLWLFTLLLLNLPEDKN